jgi:GTP cyclohydrolase I
MENTLEIKKEILDILTKIGIQDKEVLENTPKRVEKMYSELFAYNINKQLPKLAFFETDKGLKIIIRKIKFCSTCAHHLMPFFGSVRIEFISEGKTLGLSKFNRLVSVISKQMCTQEELTQEIYYVLKERLETDKIKITTKAQHMCVKARGIKDQDSVTIVQKGSLL